MIFQKENIITTKIKTFKLQIIHKIAFKSTVWIQKLLILLILLQKIKKINIKKEWNFKMKNIPVKRNGIMFIKWY